MRRVREGFAPLGKVYLVRGDKSPFRIRGVSPVLHENHSVIARSPPAAGDVAISFEMQSQYLVLEILGTCTKAA